MCHEHTHTNTLVQLCCAKHAVESVLVIVDELPSAKRSRTDTVSVSEGKSDDDDDNSPDHYTSVTESSDAHAKPTWPVSL